VADHAVSVIKEMTGRDISGHRPRDLAEVDLRSYERVVVLDPVGVQKSDPLKLPSRDTR
jgi:protein-tyrosine-phosphatase